MIAGHQLNVYSVEALSPALLTDRPVRTIEWVHECMNLDRLQLPVLLDLLNKTGFLTIWRILGFT